MQKENIGVEALKKYEVNGSLDLDWLNNEIQLWSTNTRELYNEIVNSKVQPHTIAFQALALALASNGYVLSNRQIKRGFELLGLDYKEALKPSVEYVEQERAEFLADKETPVAEVKDTEIDSDHTETLTEDVEDEVKVDKMSPEEHSATRKPLYEIDITDADNTELQMGIYNIDDKTVTFGYVNKETGEKDGPFESDVYVNKDGQKMFKDENGEVYTLAEFGVKESNVDDKDVEAEDTNNEEMLRLLQERVGQQFTVGELNSTLQSLFGMYNNVFLLTSDLYNMDLAETQEMEITDDDDMYIVSFDIVDADEGIVEIVDVSLGY